MTTHNWERLSVCVFFIAAAIATGMDLHDKYRPMVDHSGDLTIHIIFAAGAVLLSARTIYSYVKGRD